jgi:hypothetical protein
MHIPAPDHPVYPSFLGTLYSPQLHHIATVAIYSSYIGKAESFKIRKGGIGR